MPARDSTTRSELSGMRLRELHKVVHRLRRQRQGHDDEHGGRGDQAHGGEVLDCVIRRLHHQVRVEAMAADAAKENCVAVRQSARSRFRADIAAGSRTVVDHDRLTESLTHFPAEGARHRVIASARREGNEETDGLGGVGLPRGWKRAGEEYEGKGTVQHDLHFTLLREWRAHCHSATKAASLSAFRSNVAVALHPSLRL